MKLSGVSLFENMHKTPPGLWQAILSKEIRPWIAEINQPLKIHLVSPNKWIYNVYYF